MNQKAYSVLFCALLASTFVHEIKAKAAANPAFIPKVLERDTGTPLTCEVVCDGNSTSSVGLDFLVNVEAQLIALVNSTANFAIILDIYANIVVTLNGNTGAAVVINLKSLTGVYIKSGGWVNVSFQTYLTSLKNGLAFLLEIKGGISFDVATASSAILDVVNEISVYLIVNLEVTLKDDAKAGIQIVVTFGITVMTLCKGILKGLLEHIGTTVIAIRWDLVGLLNILQGFAKIISYISGGISALIKAGVVLDMQILLNAGSGLEFLTNMILAIGTKFDIGAVLTKVANDDEAFFTLIAKLGGNVSTGLTGVFKVIAYIIALAKGAITLEVVITICMQFLADTSQTTPQDLTALFKGTLTVFLEAIERVRATETLSKLVITIKGLLNGTLIINDIHISLIIKALLSGVYRGASDLLKILVSVVSQLKAFGNNGLAFLHFLLVLIFQLNSFIGIRILTALGIAVEISLGGVAGSIIAYVLQSTSNIFSLLLGNVYNALIHIPPIRKIIEKLSAAINKAFGGQFSLENQIKISFWFKDMILGLFQLLSCHRLGISESKVTQVRNMLEQCTNVTSNYNFNLTYTIFNSSATFNSTATISGTF